MPTSSVRKQASLSPYVHEGHFILSSGKHSSHYVQASDILAKANGMSGVVERLAKKIKHQVKEIFDGVVSPAIGALFLGYEMARHLKLPFLFAERPAGEKHFVFRRGFHLQKEAHYLVVEDVVTTGGSVREVINLIHQEGAHVACVTALVARGRNKGFDCPFVPLETMDLPLWDADEVPEHIKKIPPTKPGSRPGL